jgi:hypothetical protein
MNMNKQCFDVIRTVREPSSFSLVFTTEEDAEAEGVREYKDGVDCCERQGKRAARDAWI